MPKNRTNGREKDLAEGRLRTDSELGRRGSFAHLLLSCAVIEEPTIEAVGSWLDRFVERQTYRRCDEEHQGSWLCHEIHDCCVTFVGLVARSMRRTWDDDEAFFVPADFYLLYRSSDSVSAEVDGRYTPLHDGPVQAFNVWGENWHQVAQTLAHRFFQALVSIAGITPAFRERIVAAPWLMLTRQEFKRAFLLASKGGRNAGFSSLTCEGLERLQAQLGREVALMPIDDPPMYDDEGNCLYAYGTPEFTYEPPVKSPSGSSQEVARLTVHASDDGSHHHAELDGVPYPLSPDAYTFLAALLQAKGRFVSAREAGVIKVDRIKNGLHKKLQAIIESKPGAGSRLTIFD